MGTCAAALFLNVFDGINEEPLDDINNEVILRDENLSPNKYSDSSGAISICIRGLIVRNTLIEQSISLCAFFSGHNFA